VKSLGADKVIDYTKEDFQASGTQYDYIYDAVLKLPKSKCRKALTPDGSYGRAGDTGKRKFNPEDLNLLKELIEADKLRPVIDRIYTLEQTAEAHSYVDKGHKKGNVVITLKQHNNT